MKKAILVLIIFSLNSCGIFNSYNNSVTENSFARKELKKKKFKEKFVPEMGEKIDFKNCYYNYSEYSQRKIHSYLRLFKNGQYAYFTSNEENIDLNELNKANYVGYYIVEDNILKLETPTGNLNTPSYRVIWEFAIKNGVLKNKKSELEYEIKKNANLTEVEPNW